MVRSRFVKSDYLHNYYLKYDERQRLGCVTVEIHPDSLSEESDEPSEEAKRWVGYLNFSTRISCHLDKSFKMW